ncbi:MAG: elongation factor Ts [Gammaproteobacteria bacterium]|nr:elongation factor Ts [Gammaproteobacteria bacterium]
MTTISAALVKDLRERTGLPMMECKKALQEAAGDIEAAIENLRKSSGMKAAKKASRTAADGVIAARMAADGSCGMLLEVNSETDFVARDANFLGFVGRVADRAFSERSEDIAAIMAGELEEARQALVQKIGENIGARRARVLEAAVVGDYVHSNNRIGVLVGLTGGSRELARDIAMHVAAVNPQVAKPEQMPAELIAKEREIYAAQARASGKPEEIIQKMIAGRVNKFLAESSLVEQPFVKDPELTVGKLLKSAGADIVGFVRFEVGEGIQVEVTDFAAEVAAQVQASR